jgi:hypothetical protein
MRRIGKGWWTVSSTLKTIGIHGMEEEKEENSSVYLEIVNADKSYS